MSHNGSGIQDEDINWQRFRMSSKKRIKHKQALPKALQTQAFTALTSNFGLLGLVQYAWKAKFDLVWWVWFGRFGLAGLVW